MQTQDTRQVEGINEKVRSIRLFDHNNQLQSSTVIRSNFMPQMVSNGSLGHKDSIHSAQHEGLQDYGLPMLGLGNMFLSQQQQSLMLDSPMSNLQMTSLDGMNPVSE